MVRAVGSTVIATSRSSAKVGVLRDAGANYAIATAEEDLVERVQALTGGKGVDVVYGCVAGTMSEDTVKFICPYGHWIVYGMMDLTPVPFPWMTFLIKTVKFDMFKVFDFTGHRQLQLPNNDKALSRGIECVSAGIETGKLPIVIDKVFKGLESLPEALRYQQKGNGTGKIVVEL